MAASSRPLAAFLLAFPAASARAAGVSVEDDPTVEGDPAFEGEERIEILPEALPVAPEEEVATDEEAAADVPVDPAELARRLDALSSRLDALEQADVDRAEQAAMRDRIRALEAAVDDLVEERRDRGGLAAPHDPTPRFHADLAADLDDPGTGRPGFALGELRGAAVAWLGSGARARVELAAASTDAGLDLAVDVLEIEGRAGPLLTLGAGKTYAPLGYQAVAMPKGAHGIDRVALPLVLTPASRGGALPVHHVGAWATWAQDTGLWRVSLSGGVGNGRGRRLDASADAGDEAAGKAGYGSLRVAGPGGFEVGGTAWVDRVEAGRILDDPLAWTAGSGDAAAPRVASATDEVIGAAWAALDQRRVRLVAEAALVSHTADGATTRNLDGDLLAAWSAPPLTPYLAVDRIEQRAGDPIYAAMGLARTVTWYHAGLRWDAAAGLALKGELGWLDLREDGAAASAGSPTWRLQAAAGF